MATYYDGMVVVTDTTVRANAVCMLDVQGRLHRLHIL